MDRAKRHPRLRLLPVVLLLALLLAGCGRAVDITNNSPKASSVYVSIPEESGRQLVQVDAGDSGSADLGDSGVYTAYILADEDVKASFTKLRDDIEAQLKSASSASKVQELISQLTAFNKLLDSLAQRATSCGGKVEGDGDAYVTIGWDEAKQVFTASCVSKAADDSSP